MLRSIRRCFMAFCGYKTSVFYRYFRYNKILGVDQSWESLKTLGLSDNFLVAVKQIVDLWHKLWFIIARGWFEHFFGHKKVYGRLFPFLDITFRSCDILSVMLPKYLIPYTFLLQQIRGNVYFGTFLYKDFLVF